jgi:ABC-2 type transport system permease protein
MSVLARYWAVVCVAFREQIRDWSALLGRTFFVFVILYIFAQLWVAVASEGGWKIDSASMVWYLAIAEIPILASPRIVRELEADFRFDLVSGLLTRPIGYFGQRYSEFVGETLAGVLWMAVLVPLQASLLTLSFPFTGMMMIKIALLIVIGSLLKTTHEFTIGVLACWIGEATPVWWVYQKLLFTLGGLMIPLQFYPDTMREIAYWLPFSPIVNGPASLLLEPGAFTDVFVRLLLWSLASFGLAYIMVKLAMKKITIQGS